MSHKSTLKDKKIISLDSIQDELVELNNQLITQSIQMNDHILEQKKTIHQLRINNMYKAHENEFIIDDNIFENDELD